MKKLGILIVILATTSLIVAGGRYNYSSSSGTGTGDMLKSVYDTGADGYVDGNDTAYSDDMNGDTNAPTRNVLYDMFNTALGNGMTLVDSATFHWVVADGNVSGSVDLNDDRIGNLVTLSGVDANETTLGTFTGTILPDNNNVKQTFQSIENTLAAMNQGSVYHYFTAVIVDPNSYYDTKSVVCLDPNTSESETIVQIIVSLDKNPATELDWDLFYADNRDLDNPVKMVAMDTTDGDASITSFLVGTCPANKYLYAQIAQRPDAKIDSATIKCKYIASESHKFNILNIIEPNEVYDVNTIVPIDPYIFAATTIDKVMVLCDINPTTEPNMTLCFADDKTFANETVICEIDTVDGSKVITSGWTDNTIPATKYVYLKFNERPDEDINFITFKAWRIDD